MLLSEQRFDRDSKITSPAFTAEQISGAFSIFEFVPGCTASQLPRPFYFS
jgi:hypothetical protein